MCKKILVTGSTGFVGSHLVRKLKESNCDVYALYRNPRKFEQLQLDCVPVPGSMDNLAWVENLPSDLDGVVHCAGLVHSHQIKDFYSQNTVATQNLISALNKKYSHLHFCLISSQAAAGPADSCIPLNENDPALPVSHYGKSKLFSEVFLKQNAPSSWKWTIIRPPMIIGPDDPAMLDVFKMAQKKIIPFVGLKGLYKSYSFVGIYDLVDILQKITANPERTHQKTYFTAHPQVITYRDIMNEIQMASKAHPFLYIWVPELIMSLTTIILHLIHLLYQQFSPRLTPDKIQEILPHYWVCNGTNISRDLGFSYRWSLKHIILVSYDDYVKKNLIKPC